MEGERIGRQEARHEVLKAMLRPRTSFIGNGESPKVLD